MMSGNERLDLSSFIKNVHKSLRIQSTKLGADKAWYNHCADNETLSKYAESMQTLAMTYWEHSSYMSDCSAESRIEWAVGQCKEYFYEGGLQKQRIREQRILDVLLEVSVAEYNLLSFDIIKLLDVGSCYNPFKKYDLFDVLAIDIAPANPNVLKCDFTNVNIVTRSTIKCDLNNGILTELEEDSFHVIIFSLLLDYLPTTELRLKCCKNAYKLLKHEGILIVISPDSKHVGANAKFMKSWRYTLSMMGFSRIKYEKLAHIHCMIFRKSINPIIPQRWAKIHQNDDFKFELNIPQDFTNDNKNEYIGIKIKEWTTNERNSDEVMFMFRELPNYESI